MHKLLFASTNAGKLSEIREVASEHFIEVYSIDEYRKLHNLSALPEIDESAKTYEGNAEIKANIVFEWAKNFASLADDSGLEVEALGGGPGVLTARYAGVGASSNDKIIKLLKELEGVDNRQAKFVSCLNLKISDNQIITARAELIGSIALTPYGSGGFGYDPVFIPDGYKETLSELKEKKVEVATHRIKALQMLFQKIKN